MGGPGKIVWELNSKVIDVVHSFHWNTSDGERRVEALLFPPEVHHNHLSFADVQLEVVNLAPSFQVLHFLQVGHFIVVGDETQQYCVVSKLDDGIAVSGHAVGGVEDVQKGAQHTSL